MSNASQNAERQHCFILSVHFQSESERLCRWPPANLITLTPVLKFLLYKTEMIYRCTRAIYACMDIKGRSLWTRLCAQPYLCNTLFRLAVMPRCPVGRNGNVWTRLWASDFWA